jgi:arginyl-tRNA synthetase
VTQSKINWIDPCRGFLAETIIEVLKSELNCPQEALLPIEQVYSLIEKPPEAKLGDFALPCFRFAKPLQQKPQDVAQKLKDSLSARCSDWIERIEVVGAFLNFFAKVSRLAESSLDGIHDGSFFARLKSRPRQNAQKTMIEFSQPNTHKEFHVGHGRNVCLGDSLVRMFRYCGYPVVAVNYPGDEGAHIAKCLWWMRKQALQPPTQRRGAWLGSVYSEADRNLKAADESTRKTYDQEISAILRAIEAKSGEVYDLWKETRQWSLDDFYQIYNFFGVKFDHYFFESEVSEESQRIVEEYLNKGVFKLDQGAVGVDLSPFKLGFSILRKSDGNTLYATKDLALARKKFEDWGIDRSIYVVADEQNHHFKQVFKVLELMGFDKAKNCHHLSYGLVTLPEGRMSSRLGNGVTFQELIDAVRKQLLEILATQSADWTEAERQDVADKLTVGSIRYGMLNTDPVKNIVFNFEEWLAFEGNSGPYLMYCYARSQSILRRATEAKARAEFGNAHLYQTEEEKELIRYLYDFNNIVDASCENYRPSSLTHYLFELCKSFNRFYKQVPVLKTDDIKLRGARLALVEAFSLELKQGLDLLGIVPPEKM